MPWGHKAFPKYIGDDKQDWYAYDASYLLANADNPEALPPIRVEQGLADNFLDEQLHPHRLEEAADKVGADVTVTAPASDLLLLLWGRRSADDLEVDGEPAALQRFLARARF